MTVSEFLLYTTVRLEIDSGSKTGTGFVYETTLHGRPAPFLITNKHVLSEADELTILGTGKRTVSGEKSNPTGRATRVVVRKPTCFEHPDPLVDLTAFPLASCDALQALYLHALTPNHVPSTEALRDLSALEEIVMVGCPIGLWDSYHGTPLFRRGVTATPPSVDFKNKPLGLVDVACFPGSSGSPICIVNEGSYPMKRSVNAGVSGVTFGNRLLLLGVLSGGPTYTQRGTLEIEPLPTAVQAVPTISTMINLGFYVKARELESLVDVLRRLPATSV